VRRPRETMVKDNTTMEGIVVADAEGGRTIVVADVEGGANTNKEDWEAALLKTAWWMRDGTRIKGTRTQLAFMATSATSPLMEWAGGNSSRFAVATRKFSKFVSMDRRKARCCVTPS
jgi:hypothetical protein